MTAALLYHTAPHLLLRNLSATSAGVCPLGILRELQSLYLDSQQEMLERSWSQCHSVSMGAKTQDLPALMRWKKRKGRCHRVMSSV